MPRKIPDTFVFSKTASFTPNLRRRKAQTANMGPVGPSKKARPCFERLLSVQGRPLWS